MATEAIKPKKKMNIDSFSGKRLSDNGVMTISKKQKNAAIPMPRL
jgi:hypothetical protein